MHCEMAVLYNTAHSTAIAAAAATAAIRNARVCVRGVLQRRGGCMFQTERVDESGRPPVRVVHQDAARVLTPAYSCRQPLPTDRTHRTARVLSTVNNNIALLYNARPACGLPHRWTQLVSWWSGTRVHAPRAPADHPNCGRK